MKKLGIIFLTALLALCAISCNHEAVEKLFTEQEPETKGVAYLLPGKQFNKKLSTITDLLAEPQKGRITYIVDNIIFETEATEKPADAIVVSKAETSDPDAEEAWLEIVTSTDSPTVYVKTTGVSFVADEDCDEMFYAETAAWLKDVVSIILANVDTSNVKTMANMFCNCYNVTTLDLSSCDFSNVTTSTDAFEYFAYETTDTDIKFNPEYKSSIAKIFESNSDFEIVDDSVHKIIDKSFALLKNGNDFNTEIKKAIDGITTIKFVINQEKPSTTPTNIVSDNTSEELAWLEKDGTTLLVKTTGQMFKTPSSVSYMFYQLSNVQEIDFNNVLDTSSSTDFSTFFSSCSALTTVDLSMIDTSNASIISGMFSDCTTLTDIDLSGFDTSNVTNMSNLFYGCNSLTNITFGENFDTGKVINMQNMFYECKALTNTDFVKDFYVTNVTSFAGMFSGCTGIVSIDLSSWDISNATTIGTMLGNCSELTSVKMPKMTSSTNLTSMSYLFVSCYKLSDIYFPESFDTSKVQSMKSAFRGCKMTNTDFLSNFNTSSVTDMSFMFYGCSALISADLSNFNTSKVTTMEAMFQGEYYLETLDISSFDTTSTTNMNYMFDSFIRVKNITTGDNFVINTSTSTTDMFNRFAEYTSNKAQITCTNKSTADKIVELLGSSTWGYTEASAPYTVKKKPV